MGSSHGSMAFARRPLRNRRPWLFPSPPTLPSTASGSLAQRQDASMPRVSPRSWRPNTCVLRNHLVRPSFPMDFVVFPLSPWPEGQEPRWAGQGCRPRWGDDIQGLRRSDVGWARGPQAPARGGRSAATRRPQATTLLRSPWTSKEGGGEKGTFGPICGAGRRWHPGWQGGQGRGAQGILRPPCRARPSYLRSPCCWWRTRGASRTDPG